MVVVAERNRAYKLLEGMRHRNYRREWGIQIAEEDAT